MEPFWHEPVWESTGLSFELEPAVRPVRLEEIDSSAWAGWWYEGCCRY